MYSKEIKKRRNNMRKILFYIGLFLLGLVFGYLITINVPILRYDLNNDGKVNVADVIKLNQYYLDN
jgi:hypothetical protein